MDEPAWRRLAVLNVLPATDSFGYIMTASISATLAGRAPGLWPSVPGRLRGRTGGGLRLASVDGAAAGAESGYGAESGERLLHQPVLLSEAVEYLAVRGGGVYLDGTLGEGGHTLRVLELSGPDGVALGIDRDPRSLAVARRRLESYGGRAITVHGNYSDMADIAAAHGVAGVAGVLLDLGFSSRQIQGGGYGISFQADEPLDMRYDTGGPSAADLVNGVDERELANLIYEFGEERRSRAIARAIVSSRPVATTGQLAGIVARAVGGPRRGRHPATRTFQALRIAVNEELHHLSKGLRAVPGLLAPGGRCVVISYHSLEDRIVKEWAEVQSARCVCPPGLPVCVCEHQPTLRPVRRRVVRPAAAEVAANPRSRSARLRVVERI